MLFSWLRNRRRRKLVAEPFPQEWTQVLESRVGHYRVLPDADRVKLQNAVRILIAEKEWEGCRGLALTDEMRVVIAAGVGILVLGFENFYFENVRTILVYPNAFLVKQERALAGAATVVVEDGALGLADPYGPILLAWDEAAENAAKPGFGENVVFHEFAHKLDMLNGMLDGTPNLPTDAIAARWSQIMNDEFRRLQRDEKKGRETLIDPYGADDPAEFFAVTTECFFDAPRAMRGEHPELYELFRDYFRQDPATWENFED